MTGHLTRMALALVLWIGANVAAQAQLAEIKAAFIDPHAEYAYLYMNNKEYVFEVSSGRLVAEDLRKDVGAFDITKIKPGKIGGQTFTVNFKNYDTLDAMVVTRFGLGTVMWLFMGPYYLVLNMNGEATPVYFDEIKNFIPSFTRVDAAVIRTNNRTKDKDETLTGDKILVFSGTKVVEITGMNSWSHVPIPTGLNRPRHKVGEPMEITEKFRNRWFRNAKKVDAAVNWADGRSFIFAGDEYVRIDNFFDRVDPGYPRKIDHGTWPELQSDGEKYAEERQSALEIVAQIYQQDTGDFCWRHSFGRGVGQTLSECPPGHELNGLLCYPKCRQGYHGRAFVCWQDCPPDFHDTGATCLKPAAIGRGVGHGWAIGDAPFDLTGAKIRCEAEEVGKLLRKEGKFSMASVSREVQHIRRTHRSTRGDLCEKWGAIYYPKCKPGYHAVGCCLCSPDCPDGMHDHGVGCTKKTYTRGAGVSMMCAKTSARGWPLEQDGLLCYEHCNQFDKIYSDLAHNNYGGGGPMCYEDCPYYDMVDCGVGACATDTATCAMDIVSMVTEPIMMVANFLTFGASSGASIGLRNALKGAKTAAKAGVKAIGQSLKAGVKVTARGAAKAAAKNARKAFKRQAKAAVKELREQWGKAVLKDIAKDALDEIKSEFGEEMFKDFAKEQAEQMVFIQSQEDGLPTRDLISAATGLDPTGVLGTIDAFVKPECSKMDDWAKALPEFPTLKKVRDERLKAAGIEPPNNEFAKDLYVWLR